MILLTSLLVIAAPLAEKQETKVDIDGATYRVLVRNEEVVVARKAFMTRRSPEEREAMRAAARKVTGCELGDAYWEGSRLVGKLSCSEPAPAPTSASGS
jgi:transcriptional regulator of nitric oxide reductase